VPPSCAAAPKQPAQTSSRGTGAAKLSLPRSFLGSIICAGRGTGLRRVHASTIEHGAVEQPVRWLISLGLPGA